MRKRSRKFINVVTLLGMALTLMSCPGPEPDIELSVSPSSITLDDSNQAEITITSNTSWNIKTTDTSWLIVTSSNGMGNRQVTVRATSDNTELSTRSAQVVVSDKTGSETRTVTVNQPPSSQSPTPTPTPTPDQTLTVKPNSLSFSSSASSNTFAIESNNSWTVKSNQSWCTINTTSGSNNATITVNVTENTSASARNATITISSGVNNTTISVSQEAAEASLILSTTSISFTSSGSSKNVTIKSNANWIALSSEDWLTVSPDNGTGDGTLTLKATDNTTTNKRYASVTVTYGNNSTTISVSQEGAEASLTASPTSVNFTSDAGTQNVTIKSNTSWRVSSSENWLTVSPTQGTGDGTLKLTAVANTTTSERTASVTISYGDTNANIAVSQDPTTQVVFTETFTVKGISFKMIKVEGGTFTMGATPEQNWSYDNEKPTHSVTLSTYYIGETEVTQELWEAVMGSNPSNNISARKPVETVSWNDCQTFITKLNTLTGKTFRLPTEAEWEFAARGGNNSRGYEFSGSNTIGDVAWHQENSRDVGESSSSYGTHTVATKTANELGLYDMSGNVWEWCQDWYGEYSAISETNPKGPASGSERVYRGGSWWYHGPWFSRVSFREHDIPDAYYSWSSRGIVYDLGLRLAR